MEHTMAVYLQDKSGFVILGATSEVFIDKFNEEDGAWIYVDNGSGGGVLLVLGTYKSHDRALQVIGKLFQSYLFKDEFFEIPEE